MAQAHHAVFLAEPEVLRKQLARGIQVAPAELTHAAPVRLLLGGELREGQILVAGLLDSAGETIPGQYAQRSSKVVSWGSNPFSPWGYML
jgi:hypothetical protein